MELIHQLQGTWRFIFEDALLDDRTRFGVSAERQ